MADQNAELYNFGKLHFARGSAPATPDAGELAIFADDADGRMKQIDEAGQVSDLAAAGHGCTVYNSTTQSIPTGADTRATFDSESFDTDGYHFTSAANLTGTVAKTAGSAAIVGSGTSFTTELSVNQVISIPGTAAELGVVKAIADDTHLTLWQTMANTASGQTATRKNSVVAIPAGLGGTYQVTGGGSFAANATGTRNTQIYKNGAQVRGGSTQVVGHASLATGGIASIALDLDAGDYIELDLYQGSGSSLNFGSASAYESAWLSVIRTGA